MSKQNRDASQELAVLEAKLDIACGLLHDIGNVLSGARVHLEGMQSEDTWEELSTLAKLRHLCVEQEQDALIQALGEVRHTALVQCIAALENSLNIRHLRWKDHTIFLRGCVEHISELLSMQAACDNAAVNSSNEGVDLTAIVNDAVGVIHPLLDRGKIIYSLTCPATLPKVRGERTKLIRVVVNLLKNACESIDQLGEHATSRSIELALSEVSASLVRLEVTDTGAGFATAEAESFFKQGNSTKERDSGFGLHNCRTIVEQHQGRISLESQGIGAGATVVLELPVFKSVEEL